MRSDDDDLYEMYIESNRCTIINAIDPVRCYFDKMRESRVLTADDTEEIINKNPTRRFKAGHFLDILQTKGNNGVQCFLDILELQNPETYQKVTNKKPRPPPPDFVKSRHSIDLDLLNKIPETIRTIHDQVKDNTDMRIKLQELEKGLQLNQKDKDELQIENDKLRTENMSLKSQVMELGKKCGELVKQNVKLKDDSMEYLKNSLEFTKEKDVYRQKWSNAQMEKNELERKLADMHQGLSQDHTCDCQRDMDAAPVCPDKDDKICCLEKEIERLDIERQILKEELDETRQNSEDIINRMYISNSELNETFTTCSSLEKEVERLSKENKIALETCQERKEKIEKYFERIQELEQEKKQLEEERIKDQKRATDESSLRTKLFTENHELENKYEDLKIRYDLLVKRNSQRSRCHQQEHAPTKNVEDTFCYEEKDFKSNTLPAHITGIPHNYHIPPPVGLSYGENRLSHPIKRRVKKKGPTENFDTVVLKHQSQRDSDMQVFVSSSVKNRGGERLNSYMDETEDLDPDLSAIAYYVSNSIDSEIYSADSSSTDRRDTVSEDSCDELELVQYDIIEEMIPKYPLIIIESRTETFTITLRMPVLGEQIEIMGGNFTGIFISKVLKKPADQCLKPGDQILSVVEITDKEERETKSFMNCTGEMASKILDKEHNPRKVSSLELTCVRDKEAFQEVIRWMAETNSNGDFFFVKCNFSWKDSDDQYLVNNGDVFRVLDTSGRARQWKANCYDKVHKSWAKKTVYIPNRKEALRECIKGKIKKVEIDKSSISRMRTAGIRCRSEHYMNVLPVKATRKSPVLLFGSDVVVATVQKLLANSQNMLQVDIVGDNLMDMMRHFPEAKSDTHLLMKGSLTPLVKSQPIKIILFLHIQNEATTDELQNIFGDGFEMREETASEQVFEGHLQTLGLHFDTVRIPSKHVYDRESLLTFLISKINDLQNRFYWLGAQNLTSADREQYSFMLEDRAYQSFEEDKAAFTRSMSENPP